MKRFELIKQYFFRLNSGVIFISGVFIFLVIRYQIKLLGYINLGDEAETIVTAKMIVAGSSLYSEIFNHHGPLTFLPGVVLELFGNFGVRGHRIPIAILQLVSLAAIYLSPLLKDGFVRSIYTGLAASVMMLYLPEINGFSYIYQVMGGLLLVITLAQYSLPAVIYPQKLFTYQIILGNILIGSLPFLAITYIPLSILLFCASARSQYLWKAFKWFIFGIVLNILFLVCVGSIPGYLAFHIYMNAEILPLYTGINSGAELIHIAFSSATKDFPQFILLTTLALALAKTASNEQGFPWRSAFIGLGMGSLLMRGISLHGLPYIYGSLVFPMVFFKNQFKTNLQSAAIFAFIAIICMVKLSLLLPADKDRLDAFPIFEKTEFSQIVQMITSKEDRIIAYSFQNLQYINSERLPASGNFFYFPWQEKYNENPKFGVKIDSCEEIDKYRPKIMFIDKLNMWGKFSWESYAGCIQKILDSKYTQIANKPYYVRNDISTADIETLIAQGVRTMKPTIPLARTRPITLTMTSGHQKKNSPLKKIGVMFGTYAQIHRGYAELHLKGNDGASLTQNFSLSNLVDNQYKYFDIDSKRYTGGEIVFKSGGGIITWESPAESGGSQTCIIYEYADGGRTFTPGCHLM